MTSAPQDTFDQRSFRNALGRYASGVTVISGLARGEPVGFTCQAFHSVSITPPLISIAVMGSSTSWPQIRPTGKFLVNILEAGQKEISNAFARSGTDKWKGVDWHLSDHGNPVIADTLMWLDCSLFNQHEAGDHTIVLGRVLAMSAEHWGHDRQPLLYYRGQYNTFSR